MITLITIYTLENVLKEERIGLRQATPSISLPLLPSPINQLVSSGKQGACSPFRGLLYQIFNRPAKSRSLLPLLARQIFTKLYGFIVSPEISSSKVTDLWRKALVALPDGMR